MGGEKWEGKIEGILNIAPIWLGVDFGGDQVFSPWVHHFRVFLFSHQIGGERGHRWEFTCLSLSFLHSRFYLFIYF